MCDKLTKSVYLDTPTCYEYHLVEYTVLLLELQNYDNKICDNKNKPMEPLV